MPRKTDMIAGVTRPLHRQQPGKVWIITVVLGILALVIPIRAQAATCSPALSIAQGLLDASISADSLSISGSFSLDEGELEQGKLVAKVQARLDLSALRRRQSLSQARLCISLIVEGDGLKSIHHRALEMQDLSRTEQWFYAFRAELPEETEQLILVVEESNGGLLGATAIDEAATELNRPAAAKALGGNNPAWTWSLGRGGGTGLGSGQGQREAGHRFSARPKGSIVRLVPPRKDIATGSTRFDALVTSDAVRAIAFYLDGEKIAVRRLRPFATRIPLANPAKAQIVRAVALDRDGRELGEDQLTVNLLNAPFRVKIDRLDIGERFTEIKAKVSIPLDKQLDRVEIYRNTTLIVSHKEPPFNARIPSSEASPEDYIRVAAFLSDGGSIDDVALLAAGVVEEVEVNLVQVQVMVSDADGRPVEDLTVEDFEILQKGKVRQIESLAYANDVPLLLGLVIDTSGSMEMIMDATKKAAVRFLGDTMASGDRAFLVDFAKQPRLLQDTSPDLADLFLALGKIKAEGTTALYDAIVFSMVQFEQQPGRKALVVLSDGDDRKSRYGPKHCVEYGQRAGVPIYLIGLGALDSFTRNLPKGELAKITKGTSGRLFFVESQAELGLAYARIQEELRSQYTLIFYTDADLTAAERRSVTVRLKRPGLSARTVVGAAQP